jgi:hypothetical protein
MKKDLHLMSLCGELKVGTFHDGVHRACFLAKATVNTFCHVNIISATKKHKNASLRALQNP